MALGWGSSSVAAGWEVLVLGGGVKTENWLQGWSWQAVKCWGERGRFTTFWGHSGHQEIRRLLGILSTETLKLYISSLRFFFQIC